jgi:prepilin-type processing-associated H-X9-DG protein
MHFHTHSWATSILPFLDEQPLYESIDFKTRATDPKNAQAVNTRVQIFVCPSTPNTDGLVHHINDPSTSTPVGTAARGDYVATAAVRWRKQIGSDFDPRLWHRGAWGEPRPDGTATVVTYGTRKISFNAIRDGLSHTTLVAESAGRPDRYENGILKEPFDANLPKVDNHMATWAISTDFVWMALYHFDTFGINSTNQSAIYGFHNGGANVAFCDGSVRFLTESTDVLTIQALITRDRRDSTP